MSFTALSRSDIHRGAPADDDRRVSRSALQAVGPALKRMLPVIFGAVVFFIAIAGIIAIRIVAYVPGGLWH